MNFNRGHLLSFYEAIEEQRKERKNHIEQVNKIDKDIQVKLLEYRINSVKRILDYIHGNQMKVASDLKRFDTLITHCCNKLNGNIDGIELELGDDK